MPSQGHNRALAANPKDSRLPDGSRTRITNKGKKSTPPGPKEGGTGPYLPARQRTHHKHKEPPAGRERSQSVFTRGSSGEGTHTPLATECTCPIKRGGGQLCLNTDPGSTVPPVTAPGRQRWPAETVTAPPYAAAPHPRSASARPLGNALLRPGERRGGELTIHTQHAQAGLTEHCTHGLQMCTIHLAGAPLRRGGQQQQTLVPLSAGPRGPAWGPRGS